MEAMPFMRDQLPTGRKLRVLTLARKFSPQTRVRLEAARCSLSAVFH